MALLQVLRFGNCFKKGASYISKTKNCKVKIFFSHVNDNEKANILEDLGILTVGSGSSPIWVKQLIHNKFLKM